MKLEVCNGKVNLASPKYIFPCVIYVFVLLTGYFLIDLFQIDVKDNKKSNLETTEFLNANLPEAQLKDEEIGSKFDNVKNAFGDISDETAVVGVNRNDTTNTGEDFTSQYADDEQTALQIQELEREKLKREAEEAAAEREREANEAMRAEREAFKELEKAIAEAKAKNNANDISGTNPSEATLPSPAPANLTVGPDGLPLDPTGINNLGGVVVDEGVDASHGYNSRMKAINAPSDEDETHTMKKKSWETSEYFNTMGLATHEPNLVKAIIDEDIKAVDGSRVRLRLLDDVEIAGYSVPKGTCLYATMSGFGKQRVKGTISTILLEDDIVKVSLVLYDMDGLEGLYVPSSTFREATQDIASSALNSTMNFNNGTSDNVVGRWGMQTLQNAYQKASNTLSKVIKKNRAKLKFGGFVYIVNSSDMKKNKDNQKK